MLVDHDESRNGRSVDASPTVVQTVWAEIRHGVRIAFSPRLPIRKVTSAPSSLYLVFGFRFRMTVK
jgi:hypothetical protein